MIKEVLHSLKNDWDRAVFYWLVFVLTSMFMFMFFHLSLSNVVGVTFINSKSDLSTILTVFVILICMIVIFMANDFYVKKKSKELAMILICGGSYIQLVEFLLLQTGIIMLFSIPLGIFLGFQAFPILNIILSSMAQHQIAIHFDSQAIFATIIIIGFEIFWCTLLNLGYTYRNSMRALLYGEEKTKIETKIFTFKKRLPKTFHVIVLIACIMGLYSCGNDTGGMIIFGIIGLWEINQCLKKIIIPGIDQMIKKKWVADSQKVVYMGFLREDLKLMCSNLVILIATSILLLATMATSVHQTIEMTLALVSYVMMNCLLSLSFMFRFSTEITGRKNHFLSLEKIGYLKKQQKLIIKKEVITLYSIILIISLVYMINMMIVLYIYQLIQFSLIYTILAAFIIPLVICGMINYIYYKKLII